MNERVGDMFATPVLGTYDAICITTNGFVKANGNAVMGRGTALRYSHLFPDGPAALGRLIQENGNIAQVMREGGWGWPTFVSLPVKHQWFQQADTQLIERSLRALVALCDERGWQKIAVPRPGCGNGELDWARDVEVLCRAILDDRFDVWAWGKPVPKVLGGLR